MAARNYSNTGSDAELAVLVGSGDTSAALASFTGFPSHPFIAALDPDTVDEEIVLVTNVSGSTVTITRAYDGTTAKAHAAGATFRHVAAAIDFQEANDHVQATSAVHGVAGALVGTTDTQTLTNKTLSAPTISNPTVTGTLAGATADFSGAVAGGSVASDTTVTGTDITGSGTVSGLNVTATATVTGADLVATDDLTVGDDATIGGDATVTGTVTGGNVTTAGTVTGATGDFTTAVLDEIELVETASDLTAAAGRSSLWAKTDSGLYFAPNGETRRRASMHWGSGTTLPTTGAIAGDTYIHTDLASSMLRYNGTTWRQIDGPVDIANMAARPTDADLHVGFQVFSIADDDVYTYDGVRWRNAMAGTYNPSGSGAGDYVTGIITAGTDTTDGDGNILLSLGRTFQSSNYLCLAATANGLSGNATMVYVVGKTTSTVELGCRNYAGTALGAGVSVSATFHVIGYND